MIYNKIKIAEEEGEAYDRKEIALAIRNWTYDDELKCSLMDQNIIQVYFIEYIDIFNGDWICYRNNSRIYFNNNNL